MSDKMNQDEFTKQMGARHISTERSIYMNGIAVTSGSYSQHPHVIVVGNEELYETVGLRLRKCSRYQRVGIVCHPVGNLLPKQLLFIHAHTWTDRLKMRSTAAEIRQTTMHLQRGDPGT
jgi:hypothetical protein